MLTMGRSVGKVSMRRADVLRDQIEEDIVTGALAPGERLDEQSLATRFNVSRTPIREALAMLASADLVTLHPRRGAFVAALGVREIVERFEMMAAIEGMCGRLAARRITAVQRQELTDAHEDCRRQAATVDADAYYYANERFHNAIYDAAHNAFLAEQARALRRRLRPFRRLQLRLHGRVAASFAEHEAIMAAILEGDPDGASARLQLHILIQGDRLTDFVATLEAGATGLASAG
jgi:DNA-binding GntR family transcriptional regulator